MGKINVQILILLVACLIPIYGFGQSQSTDLRKPIISHIDIMERPVNFSRLNDDEYRQSLPFGNQLLESFDSLEQFTGCPNRLELPHDLNSITLHFSHPNWKASHDVLYSYMVQGQGASWSIPTNDPLIEFKDLKPGSYVVQIKARPGSGNWSGTTAYHFSIQLPWWKTWWAITLASLVVFVAVASIFRYWLKRQSEIQEMYHLLEAYKKSALSPLSVKSHLDIGDSFLRLVNHTLETHLSDENFGIAELCELLNISRAQLHRKLKSLTGLSTSHYIRSLRLEMAKDMFRDPSKNISEVAFAVGFSNAAYFSRVFKAQYGISPTDARDDIQNTS